MAASDTRGSRPLDDVFARGRRHLRELNSSSATAPKALEQATSPRCDLQRQLQEWRKESDAKKRKGNTGLLIPPRMSLDRLEDQDSCRRLPRPPGGDSFASRLGRRLGADTGEKEDPATSSGGKLGSIGGLRGLVSVASAPSLPTFDLLTPPRPAPRAASPQTISAAADTLGLSVASAGHSDRSATADVSSNSAEEVAALRRYLVTVQSEIAERDRQLQEFDAQDALSARDLAGGESAEPCSHADDGDIEEELLREQEQVQQLEAALAEADLRIRESEEQLRLDELHARDRAAFSRGASPAASGLAPGCVATRGSEAPSLASTAPTGPPSAEQIWQERARALEREIRCEAAQATELQDRIHWLRNQLRRQPHSQDERIVSINQMFKQIGDRLEYLNCNAEASTSDRGMLIASRAQPLQS